MAISSWSRLLWPCAAPELLAPISHSYTAFVHFLKRGAFSPGENQTLLWEFGSSQRSPMSPSPHLSLHVTFPLNLVRTSMYLSPKHYPPQWPRRLCPGVKQGTCRSRTSAIFNRVLSHSIVHSKYSPEPQGSLRVRLLCGSL
jgi:hypothetical protein